MNQDEPDFFQAPYIQAQPPLPSPEEKAEKQGEIIIKIIMCMGIFSAIRDFFLYRHFHVAAILVILNLYLYRGSSWSRWLLAILYGYNSFMVATALYMNPTGYKIWGMLALLFYNLIPFIGLVFLPSVYHFIRIKAELYPSRFRRY